ncbi:putative MFS transporter, AGZA family, xanthine/uracil permease [Cetobacterium ceti]|uniref:Putative MFS transporter, AGZA family, xanthine/uracil permease n=1 Tax=Cetobacterium ceti TaxID=180163 RepID=A0A1T4NFG4_9FUSO|nr:NCS2 family permease [Cetobacterium ceti]SJZ77865.1 putative MFS transporter, AGZA family, xanthine/uracil permease [Cetobacterium ceti]
MQNILHSKQLHKETFLDKFFKISQRESTVKTEIIGGITTFLTMAYIIFVNPSILSDAGMNKGALITVTCLASGIGTLIAGLWANAPFALAPGMGLNAFFTYTLVLGKGVTWEEALGVVFISGLCFLILTLGGIREKIAKAIPKELSIATTAGIGLFIAFIGLKNMGLIASNNATFVTLGNFSTTTLLSLLGLLIMALFEIKKIKGGILISILTITIISLSLGIVSMPNEIISLPPSINPIFMKLNILGALKISLMGSIFSFMFIDLFDSLGVMLSCYKNMGLGKNTNEEDALKKMLHVDVTSTLIGSVLGTSTVTSYAESTTGIAAGARTGLSSVIIAGLFFISLLFTPIIGVVPGFATAPALVMVGIFMFQSIGNLDLKDLKIAIPAFITIIMMPLTYSISTGLSFGFISYVLTHIIAKEFDKISITLWFIFGLSILNLMV